VKPRTYEGSTNRRGRHAVAWSALAAITLLLASLVQTMVTRALVEPEDSPATAALIDGDDVRARFLASIACDPSLRVCAEW
jgi:hypothetical protein